MPDGWRRIRGAQNMKEFQPDRHGHVFHGTCQETAVLGGLHAVDPDNWPMNGNTLGDITHEWIQYGYADSSGASAPRAARWYLPRHGFAFFEVATARLADALATYGGIYPVVVEYAAAGVGLPGDERGVQFHYNCVVSYNTLSHNVECVDGDNIIVRRSPDGYGPLAPYSLSNLQNAHPVNVLVIKRVHMLDFSDEMVKKYYQDKGGNEWFCPKTGQTLHGGILDYYKSIPAQHGGLTTHGLPLTPEVPIANSTGGAVAQLCERGVIIYDPDRSVDDPPGSEDKEYNGHVEQGIGKQLIDAYKPK
jgi:hypothetical protein